jgi:hypothetical protein
VILNIMADKNILTKGIQKMKEKEVYKCSQCGKQEIPNIRYLACAATSQWDWNNYPAPNTFVTTKDDIKLWKLGLCDTCMPQSYKIFLQNRIKKTAKIFGICLFLLAFCAGVIYSGIAEGGPYLLGAAIAIGLIIGIIGVPVNLIILIVNSARLRKLVQTGLVDKKNQDKSFIGEGERLIKEMEKGQSSGLKSAFPLPQFKELKDVSFTEKEKEKIINKKFGKGERSIIAISTSLQELEKALPSEWLKILKTSKKKKVQ